MLWDQQHQSTPDMRVVSDASGNWGCGAFSLPKWFTLEWPTELQSASIQIKELIPAVIAAALFGKEWTIYPWWKLSKAHIVKSLI